MKHLKTLAVIVVVEMALALLVGFVKYEALGAGNNTKKQSPCSKFRSYDREACEVTTGFIRGYFRENYPAICWMVTDRFMFKWSGGWNVCLSTPKGRGEKPPVLRVAKVVATDLEASVWVRAKGSRLGLWCLVRMNRDRAFKIDASLPAGAKCPPHPLSAFAEHINLRVYVLG